MTWRIAGVLSAAIMLLMVVWAARGGGLLPFMLSIPFLIVARESARRWRRPPAH